MSKYRQVAVEFTINERQQKALEELLPYWQQYTGEDGDNPFKDWTIDDLFNIMMQTGISKVISAKIKEHQFRQGMIDSEELINGEPFYLMEERKNP